MPNISKNKYYMRYVSTMLQVWKFEDIIFTEIRLTCTNYTHKQKQKCTHKHKHDEEGC